MLFFYKGLDESGRVIRGIIRSSTRFHALKSLVEKNCLPTHLLGLSLEKLFAYLADASKKVQKINDKSLYVIVQKLALLLHSGMPLIRALKLSYRQHTNAQIKQVLFTLTHYMQKGYLFHEALSQFPQFFDSSYVRILQCAENGGYLSKGLDTLCEIIEHRLKTKKQLQLGLIYPCLVFLFGLVITSIVCLFVLPRFEGFFIAHLHGEIPWTTQCIFALGKTLRSSLWVLLTCLLPLTLWIYYRKGSIFKASIWGHIPFLRNLLKNFHLGIFTMSLSNLLKNGLPLIEALTLSAESSGKDSLSIKTILQHLNNGKSFADALSTESYFPLFLIESIQAGEESGALITVLEKTSEYYFDCYERSLNQAVKWLEPLLIIGLAFLIGTLVLGLFFPLIQLFQAIDF